MSFFSITTTRENFRPMEFKKRKQFVLENNNDQKRQQLLVTSKRPYNPRNRTKQTAYELVRDIQESFAVVSKDGTWEFGHVWHFGNEDDWNSVWVRCFSWKGHVNMGILRIPPPQQRQGNGRRIVHALYHAARQKGMTFSVGPILNKHGPLQNILNKMCSKTYIEFKDVRFRRISRSVTHKK